MAESGEVKLSVEAEAAIRRDLVRLAIPGMTTFGFLDLVSLVTFVPNLAAARVTESETLKKVREEALLSGAALQENLRRAREELDATEKALKDLGDKVLLD